MSSELDDISKQLTFSSEKNFGFEYEEVEDLGAILSKNARDSPVLESKENPNKVFINFDVLG